MYQLILIIHVLVAICLIFLVLVQQGKGAAMGAAFGSGASQTVFGSRGSGSFLLRLTIGFVVIFFATSIGLNYLASRMVKQAAQVNNLYLPAQPTQKIPNIPVPASSNSVTPNNIPMTLPAEKK
jgi:preprotein translocase subunit SecG